MFLYVMRHGEAKTKDEDPERGLTERGREEVSSISAVLSRTGARIDEIWHSGKRRAEQTAGILAERLSGEARVVTRNGLNPNDSPGFLVEELEHRSGNLAIVGHLPQLGQPLEVLREAGHVKVGGGLSSGRRHQDDRLSPPRIHEVACQVLGLRDRLHPKYARDARRHPDRGSRLRVVRQPRLRFRSQGVYVAHEQFEYPGAVLGRVAHA